MVQLAIGTGDPLSNGYFKTDGVGGRIDGSVHSGDGLPTVVSQSERIDDFP